MFYFVNDLRSFVNYAIFRELCDRMRFEVDCAKSHHRVISEGLQRQLGTVHFSEVSFEHHVSLSSYEFLSCFFNTVSLRVVVF